VKKQIAIVMALSLSLVSVADEPKNSAINMAAQNGVSTCLPTVVALSDHVLKDKSHSTHAYWHSEGDKADGRMFSAMNIKSYSDGDAHVVITAAQTSGGGCDGYYTETFALPTSCEQSREQMFATWHFVNTMGKDTVLMTNTDKTAHLYLTPQGGDICLVTKREAVYRDIADQ